MSLQISEDLINAWSSWNKALQFQTSATNDSLVQNILQIPMHILLWHSSVLPWLASIPEVWPNQCSYRYLVEQNHLIPQPSAEHHLLHLWKIFSGGVFRVANSDLLQFLTATENWKSSQTYILSTATENSELRLKTRDLLQLIFRQLRLKTQNLQLVNCNWKLWIFSNSLLNCSCELVNSCTLRLKLETRC